MDDQATTIIPSGSLRAALKQGQQLDSTGAQIFLDIFNPAYSESIGADFEFEIDSIIPVSEGAPALIVVRDRSDNRVVCRVPFVYSGKFNLPDVMRKSNKIWKLPKILRRLEKATRAVVILSDYLEKQTWTLKEGDYKLMVIALADNGETIKSREHHFTVTENQIGHPAQSGKDISVQRYYCVAAWKTLLLREYGSMPCCNLVRNEKMLYNTYADGGYDPWNNKSWKALRQSLVDGNPKYCHPTCPFLTNTPVSKEEFLKYEAAVDLQLCEPSENEDIRYQAYLEGENEVKVGPSRLGVMVGTICNIDCIFCPIPFQNNRRTVFSENMLQLLEKHIGDCQQITFTGGEPLVYIKELRKLEKLFHKDLTIQIVTNGVAVDHLIDFGGPAHLALRVSINVANSEDYIYLHGKDFFDRIIKALKKLKQKKPDAYVSLKFIIMKTTVNDITNFAKLCRDLKVNHCMYTTLWIKEQSSIDPNEKIIPSDKEWETANEQLFEAESLLKEAGISFGWSGWDNRPDDYDSEKHKIMTAKGTDSFE